jgi:hypothetical protein
MLCPIVVQLIFHQTKICCIWSDHYVHSQDALRCLALLSSSASICDLFVSLVKRFDLEDNPLDPESIECQANKADGKDIKSTDAAESKECQANEVDGKDKKSTDAAEMLNKNNKRFVTAVTSIYSCKRLVLFAIVCYSVDK